MSHADHSDVLHRVHLERAVSDLARRYNIAPSAHADVVRRLRDGTTIDARGELIARSGEPVADYISARLDYLSTAAEATHLFVAAVDPAEAPRPASTRKLTARDRLSIGNGVDPYEGF